MAYKKLLSSLLAGLVAALFISGCDGCGSEEEVEPEPVEPPAVVEKEPEDPLEEARDDATDQAESAAVITIDAARATTAAMEALDVEPEKATARKPPKKQEPTGSIDTRELKRAFNRNNAAMQKCYERVLKKEPGLEGKISLQVKIKSNGELDWARAKGQSLNNATINECMERQARSIKFPKPSGGSVIVANPYTFTPDF